MDKGVSFGSRAEMNFNSEFELSRIYAHGWNAAKALPVSVSSELSPEETEKLNPYKTDREGLRWSQGFAQGLREGPPLAKRFKVGTSQKNGAAGEKRKAVSDDH
jgi:hypothetical protein